MRLQLECLITILDGPVVFLLMPIGIATIVQGLEIVRLDSEILVVILNGPVVIPFSSNRQGLG